MLHHAHHQTVMATAFFEVLQLVEQITRWFASNAWEIRLVGCDALSAMTGGAGLHALGHAVGLGLRLGMRQ